MTVSPTGAQQIGRLAMRVEGGTWVAYYALAETMEGAIFLGSIKMAIVQDPNRKRVFMDLMKDAVSDILEERVGVRPEWPDEPQAAPENERSGSA